MLQRSVKTCDGKNVFNLKKMLKSWKQLQERRFMLRCGLCLVRDARARVQLIALIGRYCRSHMHAAA